MLQLCCIQFCTATKWGAVCVSRPVCLRFHATTTCRFQPRTPEIITSEASLSSFHFCIHFCIVCLKEKGTKLTLTNLNGCCSSSWPDITFLVTWCDPVLGGYHFSSHLVCAPVVGRISLFQSLGVLQQLAGYHFFQSLGVILCWVDITFLVTWCCSSSWPDITFLVTWCAPVLAGYHFFQSFGVILCWGGYHLSTLPTLPLPLPPSSSSSLFYTWLGPFLRTDGSQLGVEFTIKFCRQLIINLI